MELIMQNPAPVAAKPVPKPRRSSSGSSRRSSACVQMCLGLPAIENHLQRV